MRIPEKLFRRRTVIRVSVALVFLLAVGGLLVSWLVGGALVAAVPNAVGDPPKEIQAVEFRVASESGSTIVGWQTCPSDCRGVVVLLHGIRGSRRSMLPRARLLYQHGIASVMIDLQAHGESQGAAITMGYLEKYDVRAAIEFARKTYPDLPVGVIGVSLGGAAATLASPLDVDACVIESVYPDIESAIYNRVGQRLGAFSAVPSELLLIQLKPRLGVSRSELRPIDRVAEIGCPLFVISGAQDPHTTASETRRIYGAAQSPKDLWLIEDAGHVDLYNSASAEYEKRVIAWLERYFTSALAGTAR